MPGAASFEAALFLLRFFSAQKYPGIEISTSGTFLLLIGDLIKLDLN